MSFDTLAPHYRWMEFALAGRKLQRCRLAWLNEIRDCRNVLLVGEGPGRFLSVIAGEIPEAVVTCVDASGAMLERARRAWRRAGGNPRRATFIQGVLPGWQPPGAAFDLIATHFFLDCFPHATLAEVIAKLAPAATTGARWIVSDFQIPTSGLARLRARAVLALAYRFFRVVTRLPAATLVEPGAILDRHGFRLRHHREFNWGLLYSDLRMKMASAD